MTAKQWIVGFLIVSMIFLLLFFVIRMQKTQVVFQEKQVEDTKNDDLNDLENLKMEIIQCERKLLLRRPDIRQKAALKVLTPWLAPIIWDGTYDLRILNNQLKGKRIGLFVFAVKKYIRFLLPFLESAEQHFMVGYNVTYYAFTDNTAAVPKISLGAGRILNLLEVEADKRWQDISMKRMQILVNLTHDRLPKEVDYLVCADVDMVFNDHVGVEILGDLVATIHPGLFLAQRDEFTYDRNPESHRKRYRHRELEKEMGGRGQDASRIAREEKSSATGWMVALSPFMKRRVSGVSVSYFLIKALLF
ncbi:hypothetical protein XELAEV_18023248mg [Xenopus laevis]|uniref:Uncharacterized protein n=1 Tax=Xenopus laevis TaxID=8355 RepID=A0A974HP47_XENLA|nr:hypothetical protein XELAEV_18023248mg [Xenopus laevis]